MQQHACMLHARVAPRSTPRDRVRPCVRRRAPARASVMLDSNSLDLEGCNVRLRDGASSLVDQYGDLLRSAKSHGEVEQQAGELKTATLAQSTSGGAGASDADSLTEAGCDALVGLLSALRQRQRRQRQWLSLDV